MEPVFQAHPIPQNVTNFEFHLVGDMTLKQFGYLAAGVGIAFLVFTTLSTVQPLIAWPIIIISALLGVAFAFLPIQERPLDHWVAAFFKAIFKPTSLKYSSKIISPTDPLFNHRLNHYLRIFQRTHTPQLIIPVQAQRIPQAKEAYKATMGADSTKKQSFISDPRKKGMSFIDKFKAGQTNFSPPAPASHTPAPPAPATRPTSTLPTPPAPKPQTIQNAATLPISPLPVQQITPSVPALTKLQPPAPQPPQPVVSALPDLNPASSSSFQTPSWTVMPSNPKPAPQNHPPTPIPSQPETNKSNPPIPATPADLKKTVELAKEAQQTQEEIVKIEASLSQIKQQAAQPGVDPKTYIKEFEDLLTQLQKLNEKASETAKKLADISDLPNPKPLPADQIPAKPAEPIKAKSIPTLKLTSFPNVINGIVTDSLGNYIDGAIVVAHDKQGLPVRALKSNKLGQFVAATPLPNGEYSIVVEKDDLMFDKVAVELKNEVLPPILVAAKKIQAAT